MKSQLKFVITAALVCHLFPGTPLVISQARPPESAPQAPDKASAKPVQGRVSATEGEPVTISAQQQEKSGDIYTLRGEVAILFRNYTLHADSITYNSSTGDVTAEGNVALDGGAHNLHITASRGTYNIQKQTGKFYEVSGTVGARFKGKNAILVSSGPLTFSGEEVDKTGPETYVIYHGKVTSCEQPKPKWNFSASRIELDLGGSARIYNTVFRIKGIPLVYLPFAAHPVDQLGRQSGFLVPTFGTSSRKGTILGDSFYWAINRSMDATLGAEYFTKRGWSMRDNFRAKFSDRSYINFDYFGVLDRGFGTPKVNQGGEDVKLNAEAAFPRGFRGVASLNYLSSFVFRLAFTENFSQAVNSEVKSVAFLSKTFDGISINGFSSRYQNFQSTAHGDLVTIFHAPGFEISSVDQRVGDTRLFWSFDASADGLRRTEPGFDTPNLVGRFDVQPNLSLPVFFHGWTLRPDLSLRNTLYSETRVETNGVGLAIQDAVNRRAIETTMELRPPVLGKILDRTFAGRKVKHTIEPRIIYRFVNGVDNFPNIIRFDYRDLLSDTNEVEYGLTQRLFMKHAGQDCPPEADQKSGTAGTAGDEPSNCAPAGSDEFVTWEVKQKYFLDQNFGGALVNGRRNVLTTSADFAGIAFLTEPRLFSPIVSRLRVRTTRNSDLQWELDYDSKKGRVNASTFFTTLHLGDFVVQGSHAFLQAPGEILVSNPVPGPTQFNQYRALFGYGSPSKQGLSAAVSGGFDSNFHFLQYSAAQMSYNWDCCGVSFEYRRFALGSVRNENSYRFALTLANIGTFGNLKRQERLF